MAMASIAAARKQRILRIQILTWLGLLCLVMLASLLVHEVLRARNIATGFGFLAYPASFDLSESLLPFTGSDTYAKALFIGFLNTIKAALACILLATVLGVLVGLARLSSNPLLSGLAGMLVELTRNVPPLLQVFAWYALIQFSLPSPARAWQPAPGFALTNRGFWIPGLSVEGSTVALLGFALVPAILAWLAWPRIARRPRTSLRIVLALAAMAAGLALAMALGLGSVALDLPQKRGFNFNGGLSLSPEFAALVFSLSLYTSGFIAEIVRGAIAAVPSGQREAAAALGLRHMPTIRLVVLPQALRIAIPPVTSQYINVTKSTSLAVAIGYADIVSIGNTIMNQSGRAIEVIALFVVAYLVLSLTIAGVMNRLNGRIALVQR